MKRRDNQPVGKLDRPYDLLWGMAAVLLGICGLSLPHDRLEIMFGWREQGGFGPAVATLEHVSGSVRHQRANAPVWVDLSSEESSVYNGDSIFTGPSGTTTLRYADGRAMRLLPNTLIVIRIAEDDTGHGTWGSWLRVFRAEPLLDLRRGSVELSAGKAGAPLLVRRGKENLKLEASEGRLVQVSSGEGLLATPLLTLSAARPAFAERLFAAKSPGEGGLRVPFAWQVPAEPAGTAYRLELRGDNATAVTLAPGQRSFARSLAPGNYEWRLTCSRAGAPCGASAWSPFSAAIDAAPVPVFPRGTTLYLPEGGENLSVTFRWEPGPFAKGGRLELKSVAPDKPLALAAATTGRGEIKLPAGRYRWRASDLRDRNALSPWSEAFEFTVGSRPAAETTPTADPIPPRAAEKKISAPPPFTVEAEAASTAYRGRPAGATLHALPLRLRWAPIAGAKKYSVALFNGAGNLISAEEVTEPAYGTTLRANGRHPAYYEVKARGAAGEIARSVKKSFVINYAAPEPGQPRLVPPPNPEGKVLLTWEKTLLTPRYEVQISREPKFRAPASYPPVTENLLFTKLKERGVYYWRVRSLYAERASEWSGVRNFVIR